jgi:uncharacterized protein
MTNSTRHWHMKKPLITWSLLLGLLLGRPGVPELAAQSQPAGQDSEATVSPDSSRLHDPGFTKIMVIARADLDSVVLRWAPATPHGWRVANRTGYVVERRTGNGDFVRLTPDTLHPMIAMQLIDEMKLHPEKTYLGLVVNALWADSVLMEADGSDTMKDNAERNTNLYGYALFVADNDPYIASLMGLRFVDRNVKAGEHYTYRVRLNEGREYRIDPGEVDVDVRAAKRNPPPVNLTARGLDSRIELRWDPQPANEYTGYIVARSADGGKTFTQLNKRPIVIVTRSDAAMPAQGGFTDTTAINYKSYRYRVHGITAFGEPGEAAEVRVMARDLTPPLAPRVKNPTQVGRTGVQLEWDIPAMTPDLAGFIVSRSSLPDSNFHDLTKKLLPKTARQFLDKQADEAEPYYIVAAIDTAGNRAPSFPLLGAIIDTLPPAAPTGLRGTIDTAGVVHLAWHPNKGRNILGYRVLRANALDHEFTQLTGEVCRDTVFADTVDMRTLTRNVFYKIAAVNLRYNHSKASPPLRIGRPDRIPPEAPVFSDVQVSDSAVVLRWAASRSQDVASQVLSRRVLPGGVWANLATLPKQAEQFVDRAVTQNTLYEYRVEAVDSSGLHAPALLTVQARPYDTGIRAPVRNLTAIFNQEERAISLTWVYAAAKGDIPYFVIYRMHDSPRLARYRSVDSGVRTFTDKEIAGSGVFEYAVKVMTPSGAESPLSERVRVQIPQQGK